MSELDPSYFAEIKRSAETPEEFTDRSLELYDIKNRFEVEISREASRLIPRISYNDLQNEFERFCVFCGSWNFYQGVYRLNISHVLEHPVLGHAVSPGRAKVYYPTIKLNDEHFARQVGKRVIGDLHTHPCMDYHYSDRGANPSDQDLRAWKENIQNLRLGIENPMVHAITFLGRNGRQQIRCYRYVYDETLRELILAPVNEIKFEK